MIRCLVVDDDVQIRTSVQDYLKDFGMSVTPAASAAAMRQAVVAGAYDVVVLDLMLPDGHGLALCQWVQQEVQLPVIVLTAQGDAASRVVGLEMGADDYIGKPFEPRELVARIKAVLRRSGLACEGGAATRGARAMARFDGWCFDRLRRELLSPRQVLVALSNAEYRLLSAFVDHPRRVLSRDQLIELTRAPGVEVNDRSVDLAVSRLRQKLDDAPREPRLIRTLRGEGYLFDPKELR
ncbi:response regulator transcription factor [Aquabacterium sp. A7-Y]|uniref:response regulator n=1 Tax=Aquabacterium sp. A7-Y TaxID=1349605 RepID=UPI00223D9DB4|nr:response regulator transcription factor [Aquabacterium sp. A7-Y]MCW7540089.1 response regulator transcription factor [Aquabacterium sp. A7-Y]